MNGIAERKREKWRIRSHPFLPGESRKPITTALYLRIRNDREMGRKKPRITLWDALNANTNTHELQCTQLKVLK